MATQPDYRAKIDLFMIEGDTFGRYRFKMRTGTNPDTYENLAGCTFLADITLNGTSLIESSTANGRMGLVTGAEAIAMGIADNEAFWWEVDAPDMAAAGIVAGKYKYDIQFTYSNGTIRTRVYGTLHTKGEVSE